MGFYMVNHRTWVLARKLLDCRRVYTGIEWALTKHECSMGYFMGHRTCRIEPEHGVYGIRYIPLNGNFNGEMIINTWIWGSYSQTNPHVWMTRFPGRRDGSLSFFLFAVGRLGRSHDTPRMQNLMNLIKMRTLKKPGGFVGTSHFQTNPFERNGDMAPAPSQLQESSGNVLIARDGSRLGW